MSNCCLGGCNRFRCFRELREALCRLQALDAFKHVVLVFHHCWCHITKTCGVQSFLGCCSGFENDGMNMLAYSEVCDMVKTCAGVVMDARLASFALPGGCLCTSHPDPFKPCTPLRLWMATSHSIHLLNEVHSHVNLQSC